LLLTQKLSAVNRILTHGTELRKSSGYKKSPFVVSVGNTCKKKVDIEHHVAREKIAGIFFFFHAYMEVSYMAGNDIDPVG
jgi:hypothetical protein